MMWLKAMQAMLERNESKPPMSGRGEIDDACLDGARSGGKRGRGVAGKTPFVAAIETTADRRPRKHGFAALFPFVMLMQVMTMSVPARASEVDIHAMFERALSDDRVGVARKSALVDARPAEPGEIVETIIAGEGTETVSPPAQAGDMVVRNRCEATGNEAILVTAASFAERYEGPLDDAALEGWRAYRPRGVKMRYFLVREEDGDFSFMAPWGEPMTARPGDAIVRSMSDPSDTYRIAAAAFACTYEILEPAPSGAD